MYVTSKVLGKVGKVKIQPPSCDVLITSIGIRVIPLGMNTLNNVKGKDLGRSGGQSKNWKRKHRRKKTKCM